MYTTEGMEEMPKEYKIAAIAFLSIIAAGGTIAKKGVFAQPEGVVQVPEAITYPTTIEQAAAREVLKQPDAKELNPDKLAERFITAIAEERERRAQAEIPRQEAFDHNVKTANAHANSAMALGGVVGGSTAAALTAVALGAGALHRRRWRKIYEEEAREDRLKKGSPAIT